MMDGSSGALDLILKGGGGRIPCPKGARLPPGFVPEVSRGGLRR